MKVLHQVWVQGEDNLPSEYAENRRKWVELLAPRGWTFKLWDNRSACGQWKDYAEHEASCYHHATRCDLILARALRDFGGLCCGTDVVPHNGEGLLRFIDAVDSFVVVSIKDRSASNGLAWFRDKDHPFITCVCRHQLRNPAMLSDWNVWKVTGPRCWYEALERYLWRITMVSDSYAYTRLYSQSETTNNDGWVDPGYAGSWHRKKPR